MIFKSIEKIDEHGNITDGLGWNFSEVGKENSKFNIVNSKQAKQNFADALFEQSLKQDVIAINAFNEAVDRNVASGMQLNEAMAAARSEIEWSSDAAKNYCTSMDDVDQQQKKSTKSAEGYRVQQQKQYDASKKNQKGFKGLSTNTKAMLGNVGAMLAIGVAVSLLAKGFEKLNSELLITDSAKTEAMESTINNYNEAIEKSKNSISTIQSLSNEFNTLAKGVSDSGKNIGLSADQFTRYNELVNELIKVNPEIITGYNSEGQAIVDRNTAISESIKLQEEYARKATVAYTTDKSVGNVLAGIDVETKKILKSARKTATQIAEDMPGQTFNMAAGTGGSIKLTSNLKLNDYLKEQATMESASYATLSKIAKKRGEILKDARALSGEDKYSVKELESLDNKFIELQASLDEYETAYQPAVAQLSAYVAKQMKSNGETFGDIIPEAMLESYNKGLYSIASSGKDPAIIKANAYKFAENIDKAYNDPASKFNEIYKKAQQAKEDFMKSDKGLDDMESANSILNDQADALDKLAKKTKNTSMREFYASEALSLRDFVPANEISIANAVNKFDDLISAARDAKTIFDESMSGGDYYTGIKAFKEIYDAMFNGRNNLGNGSIAFWQGAEQILSPEYLEKIGYNIDTVKSKLFQWKPALKGGAEGAAYFAERLLANKETLEAFDGKVARTADGIEFDIPRENIDKLASSLGLSAETLTAMIDSARQFGEIEFYNIKDIEEATKQAAETRDNAIAGKEKTYMTKGQLSQQTGFTGKDLYGLIQGLDETDIKILEATDDAATFKNVLTDIGVSFGGSGKKLAGRNLGKAVDQFATLGFSLKETQDIIASMGEDGIQIGADDAEYQDVLDYIEARYDKTKEKIESSKIEINADSTESEINAKLSNNGITSDSKRTDIVDVAVNYAGGDLSGSDAKNAINGLLRGLDNGQQKVVLELFADLKGDDLDTFKEWLYGENKSSKVNIKADASEATGVVNTFSEKINKLNKTKANPKIGAVDSATPIVTKIQSAIDKLRGKNIKINASSNIAAVAAIIRSTVSKITGGSGATGTSNRRVFSSAASGRLGPNGSGGLTLTGELGPELAWIPSQSRSFIVGQYGPEMVNLPSDAVIYPADETRRIIGDTISLPRTTFGSMYTGSAGGTIKTTGYTTRSSSKSSVSSEDYNKAKALLDHQLQMGYISEKTYYDRLNQIYNKHLKNAKGMTEEKRKGLEDLRDAWIKAYEAAVKALDHQLEMGAINEEQYYTKLKKLGDSYYKGRSGYTEEYKDHLEDLKDARNDAYKAALDDLDKSLEKETITIEKYFKTVKDLQTKWLTGPEMAEDREQAVEDMFDALRDKIDDEYDDVQQLISDKDLWKAWGDGEDQVVLLEAFKDKLEGYYDQGMLTALDYKELIMDVERDIQEAINDRYDDQKDSLDEILDLVEDLVRYEAQEKIDALEEQIDAYQDVIDKKQESLQLTEQELDYIDEMNDLATQISKKQSEISILSRDDSRAGKAKLAEAQEELAELLKEQNKTQRDETLDRTTDALDKQGEKFEELVQKQIDIIEEFLDNQSAVLAEVYKQIDERDTNKLYERLMDYNAKQGDGLIKTVTDFWDDLTELIGKYSGNIETIVEILQKGVDEGKTGGLIPVHHSGLAAGFTGDGADLKQNEVYRLLTDDELVLNRNDQLRLASQLQILDSIKTSYGNLAKTASQVVNNSPNVSVTVEAPVTINGNATPEAMKQLEKFGEQIADNTLDKLTETLRLSGVRPRASSRRS